MRVYYAISYSAGMVGEAGGVRRIMESYRRMAAAAGHETMLLSAWDAISRKNCDLVHLSPASLETLNLAHDLKNRDIPFVVSPILDKVNSNLAVASVTYVDRLFGRIVHTHLGAAREVCGAAGAVCLMSEHEKQRIRSGLGLDVPTEVVFPVQDVLQADVRPYLELNGPHEFVLFVGDLSNPRKNVIRLIRACIAAKLPLVLMGRLIETRCGRSVRAHLQKHPEVTFVENPPTALVHSAMKCCRVFALPSLMEGLGFAALEAGTLGARVVVTMHGGPKDYCGPYVTYVNPYSMASIRKKILHAWESPPDVRLREHIARTLSLQAVTPRLDRLYSAAAQGVREPAAVQFAGQAL